MRRFKNILVGIDLLPGDGTVPWQLPPPSLEALHHAIWLARLNSARLTLLHSLEASADAHRVEHGGVGNRSCADDAHALLEEQAGHAAADGIDASFRVCSGKSWMELIRQAVREQHDLVVAGTRHLSEFRGFIMGSTGMKLLRKCPCPVWITRPRPDKAIRKVLVAHCLRPVGDSAMELGASMAVHQNAQLHVLHSLEFPELNSEVPASISAARSAELHSTARQHIDAQSANFPFERQPIVNIVTDDPFYAIMESVNEHDIDLVVMGTIARTGIAGFITGNTAERLLPHIACSVLAVKPAGFVSPVHTQSAVSSAGGSGSQKQAIEPIR